MSESYKSHIIEPRCYEWGDEQGWTAEVYISREHGSSESDAIVLLQETYKTREEAVKAAAAAGKQKVDQIYEDSLAVSA